VATVGLIPRLASEAAAQLAREMFRWLEEHGHSAFAEEEAAVPGVPTVPGYEVAARADLLVVLGGDGTLIHAAGLCNYREVPILGVNLGTLGFLTEVPRDRAISLLEKALRGELPVSRRMMFDVEVRHQDQVLLTGLVLNDAVVSKNALSRLAILEVTVDGRLASVYEADGLIVATPTGSTAYALSAQGPILHPAVAALALVPLAPHTLSARPVSVSDRSLIEISLKHALDARAHFDGLALADMQQGDRLVLKRSADSVRFVHPPGYRYFATLREKLGWSEVPTKPG